VFIVGLYLDKIHMKVGNYVIRIWFVDSTIRGSSPSLPANIFFLWRETFNFEAAKTPKKTDRHRTK